MAPGLQDTQLNTGEERRGENRQAPYTHFNFLPFLTLLFLLFSPFSLPTSLLLLTSLLPHLLSSPLVSIPLCDQQVRGTKGKRKDSSHPGHCTCSVQSRQITVAMLDDATRLKERDRDGRQTKQYWSTTGLEVLDMRPTGIALPIESQLLHDAISLDSYADILWPSPISLPLTRTLALSALSGKSASELASIQGLILREKQHSPLLP